jgi:ATP-dependent RNA helicase RhlE
MKFTRLGIMPAILKALKDEQYTAPTDIQDQAIPLILSGRDMLGCAQTGTGKTAAFAIPTLQLIYDMQHSSGLNANTHNVRHKKGRAIQALILTPTRELALQIKESFIAYGRYTHLKTGVVYGGVPQGPQERMLREGVDILVATPGRLNDLIQQRIISLDHIKIFILDEADRMLDMGFIHDVKRIAALTPVKKQTLLFSATMPKEIADMADAMLNHPAKVSITPETLTVDAIKQSVYFVDKGNKRSLLLHLLKDDSLQSVLVFTRTKHGADRVVRELKKENVSAQAIHGDKSQNNRQAALESFKNGSTRVLVATDIAARGIDIDELSHVVNYDLPNVPETYVHRIGRTGRAGLGGTAVAFCDIEEKPLLKDIEKLIGKRVPECSGHPYPLVVLVPPAKVVQQRGSQPRGAQPRGAQPRTPQSHSRSDQPRGGISQHGVQRGAEHRRASEIKAASVMEDDEALRKKRRSRKHIIKL